MANESRERCPKFPGFYKSECAHCQGTMRGTPDNPHFSLKEDYFNGWPVVEVLKDGGRIHKFDEHFRFGIRKAKMLVACVNHLREFWQSSDEQRLVFDQRNFPANEWSLRGRIYSIGMHPDIELSTAERIRTPWIELRASPDGEHIGLGPMKCRAICAVEGNLKDWLQRQI